MSNSKRYPEEFKIEAVRQVNEKGHSVAEVATRLDVKIMLFMTQQILGTLEAILIIKKPDILSGLFTLGCALYR